MNTSESNILRMFLELSLLLCSIRISTVLNLTTLYHQSMLYAMKVVQIDSNKEYLFFYIYITVLLYALYKS